MVYVTKIIIVKKFPKIKKKLISLVSYYILYELTQPPLKKQISEGTDFDLIYFKLKRIRLRLDPLKFLNKRNQLLKHILVITIHLLTLGTRYFFFRTTA